MLVMALYAGRDFATRQPAVNVDMDDIDHRIVSRDSSRLSVSPVSCSLESSCPCKITP